MKKNTITTDEVVVRLSETFESFDETRQEGLKTSAAIQEVKNETQLREKDRLVRKCGKNHPRVKKLVANIRYGDSVKKGLDIEIESAGIMQPSFEPKSWRVTGLVLNSELKGVSNLTISLFNEDKEWIEDLGSTCTDDKGFFALTVTDETGEIVKKYKDKPLTLTVSDDEKDILCREEESMNLKIGSIEYRQIILGEKECPPPPDEDDEGDDETPPPDDNTWTVKGIVLHKTNGKPLKDLIVKISDKEGKFAKLLGERVTTGKGIFEFIFDHEVVKELLEVNPELFVSVYDKAGEKLYVSPESIKCEPGEVEKLEIVI